MSMVNCITLNSTSRVVLTSCRNAFTMIANLSLYAVALIVFAVTKANTYADVENQYRWIAYSSIFVGCCFMGIFLFRTKEPRSRVGAQGNFHVRIAWAYWFKRVLYYEVAIVYVLTRLTVNVSQAYLAFYVINDLRMAQSAKALVPAIIYTCSFIVSVILQEIAWTGQCLKAYYTAGGIIWMFSGDWNKHAKCSNWGESWWLCICLWIIELLGQNIMWACLVCSSVFPKLLSRTSENKCNKCLYFSYTVWFGLGLLPSFCALIGVAVTYSMKLHTPFSKPIMEPLLE